MHIYRVVPVSLSLLKHVLNNLCIIYSVAIRYSDIMYTMWLLNTLYIVIHEAMSNIILRTLYVLLAVLLKYTISQLIWNENSKYQFFAHFSAILYIKHLSHLWLLLIKLVAYMLTTLIFSLYTLSLLHSFKNRWLNWFNYLALPYQSGHNVSTCCLNNACACMHGAYAFRIT